MMHMHKRELSRFSLFGLFVILGWSTLISSCSATPTITTTPGATQTTGTNALTTTLSPTPIPSNSPTQPTLTKTSAPSSTASPIKTASISPTSIQSTPTIYSSMETPQESSGLIYLSEHSLMRWDHVTNYVVPISENVYEYSINKSGRYVALLRTQNMVANGIEIFELALLDFDIKQIERLIDNTARLYSISISPDGKWIAFYPQKNGGRLKVLRTDGTNEMLELGFCHEELMTPCDPIAWSHDSRAVLWSDQRGIWLSYLEWETPLLLSPNKMEYTDPEGATSEIMVTFSDLEWSPTGRYALAVVTPSASAARWYALIDTRREQIVEIPHTFQAGTSAENTSWLSNGVFVVGRIEDNGTEHLIQIDMWEIIPTHQGLIRNIETISLTPDDFQNPMDYNSKNDVYFVDWMKQPQDQTPILYFGVKPSNVESYPAIFSLDIEKNNINFTYVIPIYAEQLYWAPDLSGALVINSSGDIYFVSIIDGSLLPLRGVLGKDADDFNWLPPTPR